jgi:Tn3 transposase DDE domain
VDVEAARDLAHGAAFPEEPRDELPLLGPQLGRPAEGHAAYIGAAVEQIRAGTAVDPHDTARLSPLMHKHINFLGRYVFTLPEPIAKGWLRPLRTPALAAGLRVAL